MTLAGAYLYTFITVPEDDIVLNRGSQTTRTVSCATSSLPEATVTFLDPEGTPAAADMTPYNGALILSSETTEPGVWTCRAQNEAGILEQTFSVHILGKFAVSLCQSTSQSSKQDFLYFRVAYPNQEYEFEFTHG